jgi:hypothetical protein
MFSGQHFKPSPQPISGHHLKQFRPSPQPISGHRLNSIVWIWNMLQVNSVALRHFGEQEALQLQIHNLEVSLKRWGLLRTNVEQHMTVKQPRGELFSIF